MVYHQKQNLLITICASLFVAFACNAQEESSTLPQPVEVEEIEEIESISEADISKSPTKIIILIGRLHAALVHMPIAWLMATLIFDLLSFVLYKKEFIKTGFLLLGLTILSMAPAMLSGFLRTDELSTLGDVPSLVETHRNIMFVVLLLCILALMLRWLKKNRLKGTIKWVYMVLVLGSVGMVGLGGHIGGKMVFGENYLPF